MTHKVQPSLSNISLNLKSGAPSLQEQLYQKILELIELKSLCPGDPIPSSRRLASEIGVSRSTVVSVYNRLLEEGLLETKNGNGTFVSEISLGVFENRKENGSTNEKFLPSDVNFQRFPTLDAKKLVNAPKMSAHHRGICHF